MTSRFDRSLQTVTLGIAIAVVLLAYFGLAAARTRQILTTEWHGSHYASLSEGFRHGRLNMADVPDPELARSSNPYDPPTRGSAPFLWDASYYGGKYYLYFSPLPVLLLYLPIRFLTGAYPTDAFVAAIFASWAFLAWLGTLRRATRGIFQVPAPLWAVFLGLANVTLFVMADVRMYEVAALCGSALVGTWAYSIVRYRDSPSVPSAAFSGACLGLAIATRPNLGVLLAVAAVPFLTSARSTRSWRQVIAWTVPLALIFIGLLLYNHARFGSIMEFGHKYQLTGVDMTDKRVCSICRPGDGSRFVNSMLHYVFLPPVVTSLPPFARLQSNNVDPATSYPGKEDAVGIGPLIPLSIVGSLLVFLFAIAHRHLPNQDWSMVLLNAGGWLVMIGVSTCWFVTTRYALDFMGLLVISSVLGVESSLRLMKSLGIPSWPLAGVSLLLGTYSVIVAILVALGRDTAQGTLLQILVPR